MKPPAKQFTRSVRRRRYTTVRISGEGIPDHECSVCDISDGGMMLVSTISRQDTRHIHRLFQLNLSE
jgi:hypothetical protein